MKEINLSRVIVGSYDQRPFIQCLDCGWMRNPYYVVTVERVMREVLAEEHKALHNLGG